MFVWSNVSLRFKAAISISYPRFLTEPLLYNFCLMNTTHDEVWSSSEALEIFTSKL